jgi:drug resistance transporter, EmrB/QacA subfamily
MIMNSTVITTSIQPRHSKWSILFTLVLMPFMATLDGTIVNVALPDMATALNTTTNRVQLVAIVYMLATSITVLFFGRLGDIKGKGKIFNLGTILFTLGSLLAGLSRNLEMLLVARVIEGVGGAASMANNQGIITEVFPSNQRGKALGIAGASVAIGTLIGPPLGGFIVTAWSWSYIFFINVPIGFAAFILSRIIIPRGTKTNQKIDGTGTVFLVLFILFLFFGIMSIQYFGYHDYVWALFGIFAIVFFVFIRTEKRVTQPILDLTLFKNPLFSLSVVCALLQFVAMYGVTIISPFFIQDVLKISAERTGLVMISFPIVMGIVSPLSGALSDKIGTTKLTLSGIIFMTFGLFMLSRLSINSTVTMVVVSLCIFGFGAGLFSSPNTSIVMSTPPTNKLGSAGSTNSFMRNFGGVMGMSFFTTMLYTNMGHEVGSSLSKTHNFIQDHPQAFVDSMQEVFITGMIVISVGIVLTLILIKIIKKHPEYQTTYHTTPVEDKSNMQEKQHQAEK